MKKQSMLLLSLYLIINSPLAISNNETISTRIVDGEQSDVGDWPWMVLVAAGNYVCGGTLINENTVLTAAHCLFDKVNGVSLAIPANQISVKVGEYNLESNPPTASIKIIRTNVHADYNPANDASGNDIALLHLATAITNISPIDLLTLDKTVTAIATESDVAAIGWGSTVGYTPNEMHTPEYPTILQDVTLPLQTDDSCQTNVGNDYDAATMICAGLAEGGKDACQGDSGGPLVYDDGGSWKQIGIVSWGAGCASAGNPGVYTRLATYSDWISNIVNNLSVADPLLTYAYTPVNKIEQQTLLIINNASQPAQLSFSLTGSAHFSYDFGICDTIDAKSTCPLIISYAPTTAETSNALLSISSDLPEAILLETKLTGISFADVSTITAQAGFANSNTEWSSGGDATWVLQPDSQILQTQSIGNNQEAILMAIITGKGRLNFEWSVDSEFNYDFLTLNINGGSIDKISGARSFKTQSHFLEQTENRVLWSYTKDDLMSDGNDQALLRNVTFETMSKAEYELQIASEATEANTVDVIENIINSLAPTSSGGGGGSLLFLLSIPLLLLRHCFSK